MTQFPSARLHALETIPIRLVYKTISISGYCFNGLFYFNRLHVRLDQFLFTTITNNHVHIYVCEIHCVRVRWTGQQPAQQLSYCVCRATRGALRKWELSQSG